MVHISNIKLIRTDTTIDLSQKAEKGMILILQVFSFYILNFICLSGNWSMWISLDWYASFCTEATLYSSHV